MKYRKKPVIIEAEVYKPGMEDGFDWGFLTEQGFEPMYKDEFAMQIPYIKTLEGKHYITPGDYIITGVKGERYPCKPDIFKLTYEPVES